MLTPQNIIGFIKSNTDFNKLAMNFINSQEAKQFIENDLGKNYEELKNNLFMAFSSTKNSDAGIKKAQQLEEGKKLEMYKELANKLIQTHGLSFHSSVILAGGFVGIDKYKVVEFLNSKGYSASKDFVENYYKNNEGFLKKLLKKDGVIVPGWNDAISSNDLELSSSPVNKDMVPVPDENLDEEFNKTNGQKKEN
jgi:hypothetical protein